MRKFVAPLLLASTSLVYAAGLTFADAKANADRDEASLGASAGALIESQGKVLGPLLSRCAVNSDVADLTAFVIVMELDANGRVVHTWRSGTSAMAICAEGAVSGRQLIRPPKAPFYTSIEMSFTD